MTNYDGKKVAILRGYPRLIDGESTYCDELYRWGLRHNLAFHTFYFHAPWKKKKPEFNDGYEHPYTIFSRDNIEEIIEEINENYDLIIMINPAKPHSGLKVEDVRAFHQMYKKLTPVKVMDQLNHFEKGINEMPFCWSYVNESDAAFNYAANSWFMSSIVKKLPSKVNRAFPLRIGTDCEGFREFYKNEDREKNWIFVGRFALYKGIGRMINVAPQVLEAGIKPVIYGMDTSIGCKSIILNHENCNNLLQPTAPRNANPIVDTYGRITREEVYYNFNHSMFAACMFKFKRKIDKSFYANRYEYTMIEAINAGCIPVVDKEWAEACQTIDGRRYIDIPYFAVVMDEDNPTPAIEEMKRIADDPELQRLYRDTAFEINSKEWDADNQIHNWMTLLFNLTKDTDKFANDWELVKYLTGSSEKADKWMELYNEGGLLPMVPSAISENKISIYTGASGKMIREVE